MQTKLSSILLSLLGVSQVPLATGFRVTFYLGSQCRGARWGDGHYQYTGYPEVATIFPPTLYQQQL